MTRFRNSLQIIASLASLTMSAPGVAMADIGYQAPTERATPIVYPNCPRGYEVIRRASFLFQCRTIVPHEPGLILLLPLDPQTCAPTDYWTSSSKKIVTYKGGSHTVISCNH